MNVLEINMMQPRATSPSSVHSLPLFNIISLDDWNERSQPVADIVFTSVKMETVWSATYNKLQFPHHHDP